MNFFKRLYVRAKTAIAKRRIEAAENKRGFTNWILQRDTPNEDIGKYEIVRVRANDLYINNAFIRGAVDMLINKTIGYGSTPQARSSDDKFNTQVENAWKRWAEQADFFEQFHFGDIERVLVQRLFLDGGVFVKKVLDKQRENKFCLQILEYNRLSDNGKPKGTNEIVYGVEIDSKTGKVVAYHFSAGGDVGTINKTIRIPTKDILHFSPFRRPGQLLGIPLLAPAIPAAYNLDEIIKTELVNKRVEASLSVFIKTNDVYGKMQAMQQNNAGEREMEIAPGMVNFLEPGEDIVTVDPQRPGKNFKEFTYLILEGIARSLGLSLEQITGDKSQVNYSSTRHSELELRDFIRPFRKALERYVLTPIWRDFITYADLSKEITLPRAKQNNQYDFEKVEWIFKGDDWVDPLKEIKAKENEVELGVSTVAEICASKGRDWQDVAKQRAKEKALFKELGLTKGEVVNVEAGN